MLDDVLRRLVLVVVPHPFQHRERDALAREREQAQPDAARHLERLQREPEGEPGRVCNAVAVPERDGHGRLHETDVAGPEGDDGRDVHVAADYPQAVSRYRRAHEMVTEADQSTESLRKAMVDLRVVFEELLERERATV